MCCKGINGISTLMLSWEWRHGLQKSSLASVLMPWCLCPGPPVRWDPAESLWPAARDSGWSPLNKGLWISLETKSPGPVYRSVASRGKWSPRIPLGNCSSLGLQEYPVVWEHLLVWLILRYQHSTFTDADQICISPFITAAWESAWMKRVGCLSADMVGHGVSLSCRLKKPWNRWVSYMILWGSMKKKKVTAT